MYAAIFFRYDGEPHHMSVQAETAEQCLSQLEENLAAILQYKTVINFRPADGMIFVRDISPTVPIGVVYHTRYSAIAEAAGM